MKTLHLVFADDSWEYDGNTPEIRPLGGAHSSLVYLTRALAKLGHDVHVYNNCHSPGEFHGVHYHNIVDITEANKFIYSDAFISLRNPRVFRAWLNAGVRILWSGDAIDQPVLGDYLKSHAEVRQNIDSIFCKSRWQAWTFMKYFNWPDEKVYVTRNAVWTDHFTAAFSEPCSNRLAYTSTPFRGLKLLLQLFPQIYNQVPDAELHVFSSLQVYQHSKEEDEKKYGHIYKLAEQPGVVMHGSINQISLARELTQSRLLAYPNTFPETSCLSVMEAMAAGCAVVTSWLAALPETVGPGGALIQGIPGTDNYNHAFVDYCVRLLKDRALWRETARVGREWIASHFTWDKVAQEWSEQINILIEKNKNKMDKIAGWLPQNNWNGKTQPNINNPRSAKPKKVRRSLRLVFADNSWSYDGSTPEHTPLGGAQSSMVYLTRQLAALGHDVHVFNNCASPDEFSGVHFHTFDELAIANKYLTADAFIALRNPTFFSNWLNASVRILWVGDAIDQPHLQPLKTENKIKQNIDCIFCKSHWQAWTFVNYFNWPIEKILSVHNAVWPDYFADKFSDPTGQRLVYSSTPFRGLELLLKLFPEIRKRVPAAELHVFSSMQVYHQSVEEDHKKYGRIYNLADQPGVFMHGSTGQKALASELTKCKVFAYPNIFPETCCTAAMEAMAAGCAVVTSKLACMPETVGPGGVLISGIPGTEDYNQAFVNHCVQLLQDPDYWQKFARAGRDWILSHFTWDKVALKWSEQIHKLIQKSQKQVNSVQVWPSDNESDTNSETVSLKLKSSNGPTARPSLRWIFADNSWPYDGNTPDHLPLDGPHSASVYLTRELAALGHEVHVFNNCPAPGRFQGVQYHHFNELETFNNFIHSDVFVALRNPWLLNNWVNAEVRILWAQDALDQPHFQAIESNENVRNNIDYIFCVSKWQAWTFLNHFHWNPQKIIVTRNGVCPDFFPKQFPQPKKLRLVYTSTPYRGLELLLKLFPKIYQAVPEAELHIFSSMQVYKHNREQDIKEYGHIYKLAEQPGVTMHGSVGQKKLAEELTQSSVLVYPNIFAETSCIAIMEALAAGCPVVTSNLAALPETVGPGGVLIPGIPGTDAYNEAFVDNCVRMLKDRAFWHKKAMEGREWILSQFTWGKIARHWIAEIKKLLDKNRKIVDEVDGWQPQFSWRDKRSD